MGDAAMEQQQDTERQHPEVLALTPASNPYLDFYRAFCATRQHELTAVFDPDVDEKARIKMFDALDVSVAWKYAWAIPDERALRIIKHYGPSDGCLCVQIVEMGAGSGYWSKLLQLRGVDIVCYDLHVAGEDEENGKEREQGEEDADGDNEDHQDGSAHSEEGDDENADADGNDEHGDDEDVEEYGSAVNGQGEREGERHDGDGDEYVDEEEDDEEVEVEQIYWTNVLQGTPKDLRKHLDRTLFLCYPDDFEDSSESMALQSLYNYSGDTVIHVGEVFGQSVCLPGPWGRTSAQEFQVHLASVFHKVLQVPLPSWHSSVDTLTVWKRTKSCMMRGGVYAFIPAEERLDLVEACASTRHLLEANENDDENSSSKKKNAKRQKRDRSQDIPKRSALAYQAEYQFGDDNVLTATFHEELRLRNEARIRNAQPAIQRHDICVSDDNPFVNNAKRIQQDQASLTMLLAVHNLILLDRLEKIYTRAVPKQFDVSHLSDEILNAPRASNAQFRRRQQAKIDAENLQMQARLHNTTGTFNTQQLAADAERHRYFSDQISKVGRRRKVKQICQALGEQQRQQDNLRVRLPRDNPRLVGQDRVGERERALTFDQPAFTYYYEAESDADPCLRGSKSLSRLDQTKKRGFSAPHAHHKDNTMSKLPQLSRHGAHMAPGCFPTLTNTTKLISALDLPRHLGPLK
ncbi:Nhac na:h antiporter, partial [Globisporangium splendens]